MIYHALTGPASTKNSGGLLHKSLHGPETRNARHPLCAGDGRIPLAEDRGFEPLRALTQPAFQASAIGH